VSISLRALFIIFGLLLPPSIFFSTFLPSLVLPIWFSRDSSELWERRRLYSVLLWEVPLLAGFSSPSCSTSPLLVKGYYLSFRRILGTRLPDVPGGLLEDMDLELFYP